MVGEPSKLAVSRRALLGCAALGALGAPSALRAQATFPTRPVTLVVAFPPGAAINAALADADLRAQFAADGVMVTQQSPAEFQAQVRRELATITDLLARTGIRLQ